MLAIDVVEDEVRELVRHRGLDPVADPGTVRRLVDEVLADYDERSTTGTLPPIDDHGRAARAVFDAVAGFGPCSSTSTIQRSRKSASTGD